MATFTWKPQSGWTVSREPNVAVVKLGDGYEQRQVKGINSLLDTYALTFIGVDNLCNRRPNIAREAEEFLKARNAVEAFTWQSPDGLPPRQFVCRTWSMSKQGPVWTLTCSFEQVQR